MVSWIAYIIILFFRISIGSHFSKDSHYGIDGSNPYVPSSLTLWRHILNKHNNLTYIVILEKNVEISRDQKLKWEYEWNLLCPSTSGGFLFKRGRLRPKSGAWLEEGAAGTAGTSKLGGPAGTDWPKTVEMGNLFVQDMNNSI